MKITKKIIDKYISKSCNQEETTVIKNWIAATNDEDSDFSKIALSDIKLEMWNMIRHSTDVKKQKVIPLYKKIMTYAAAVCAVFGLVSVSIATINKSNLFSREIAFYNTTDVKKEYQNAGIDFTLMPDSKVSVSSNLYNTKKEIDFCGRITIKNTTNSNLKINAATICDSKTSKEVVLIKNKKYYAFTIEDNNEDKLYIINRGQLKRMPEHLLAQMNLLTKEIKS